MKFVFWYELRNAFGLPGMGTPTWSCQMLVPSLTDFRKEEVSRLRPKEKGGEGSCGRWERRPTFCMSGSSLQGISSPRQPGCVLLQVHSIVFASSGTLLLCSTDPSGTLDQIRSELRAAFPGRPTKQAGIAHTTLLRLMTPEQLPPECIAAIQEICHRHTASLKGIKISVDQLWYIIEEVFSTIEGPQQDCKLQQKG